MPTNVHALIDRLVADNPAFHYADADVVQRAAAGGFTVPEGPMNLKVTSDVLMWFADHISPGAVTLETGAGHTTVILAALASRHYCLTFKPEEAERIREYLRNVGVDPGRVEFVLGDTAVTLPALQTPPLDFAYIDGCHGYPYPAMDWHFADKALKVGGRIGMDNAELRPVREHCEFLETNGAYRPIGFAGIGYFVRFYEKVIGQDREWVSQPYSRAKKDPCDGSFTSRMKRKGSRLIRERLPL